MGPFKTADGRDIYGLVADGEIAGLGFVSTFRHARGSVFGDLLWTTCAIKVASANFIAARDGYTGWRCFGIRIVGRHGSLIEGYSGLFVVKGSDDVFTTTGTQFERFGVSDAVMSTLTAHGVKGFRSRRI